MKTPLWARLGVALSATSLVALITPGQVAQAALPPPNLTYWHIGYIQPLDAAPWQTQSWKDCSRIQPTLVPITWNCGQQTTIGNSWSGSLQVGVGSLSASMGYSIDRQWSYTVSMSATPPNNFWGWIQFAAVDTVQNVIEQQYINGYYDGVSAGVVVKKFDALQGRVLPDGFFTVASGNDGVRFNYYVAISCVYDC